MNDKSINICVLTYNNFIDTFECLKSLKNLEDDFHSLTIIDNGSTDNSILKLRQKFPDVRILRLSENVGVPRGFNLGIQYSLQKGFDYIFLLNNDTVLSPDTLIELMKVEKIDKNFGLAMPQILFYQQKSEEESRKNIWSDGGYYRKFPPGFVQKDNRKNIDFNTPRMIDFAPACGILIPRHTIEKIGLFDPSFFFFFEDWDYSIRTQEAGLNIWCMPNAKLWHKVSKSTKKNKKFYWYIRGESTAIFYQKHYSFLSSIAQILYRLIRDLFVEGNFIHIFPYLFGLISGFGIKNYSKNINNKFDDDIEIME